MLDILHKALSSHAVRLWSDAPVDLIEKYNPWWSQQPRDKFGRWSKGYVHGAFSPVGGGAGNGKAAPYVSHEPGVEHTPGGMLHGKTGWQFDPKWHGQESNSSAFASGKAQPDVHDWGFTVNEPGGAKKPKQPGKQPVQPTVEGAKQPPIGSPEAQAAEANNHATHLQQVHDQQAAQIPTSTAGLGQTFGQHVKPQPVQPEMAGVGAGQPGTPGAQGAAQPQATPAAQQPGSVQTPYLEGGEGNEELANLPEAGNLQRPNADAPDAFVDENGHKYTVLSAANAAEALKQAETANKVRETHGVDGKPAYAANMNGSAVVVVPALPEQGGPPLANEPQGATQSPVDAQAAIPGATGQSVNGFQTVQGWKPTDGAKQGGTNPGGFYEAPDGSKHYVKFYKNPNQAKVEFIANEIYRKAGINAPQSRLVNIGGGLAVANEVLEGGKHMSPQQIQQHAGVKAGFLADAFLANHDVVGMAHDNIMVDPAGNAHRIDNGGSLMYRAQGGKKANFNGSIGELDSMRNPDIAQQAGPVFKPLTQADITKQAADFTQKVTPSDIDDILDRSHLQGDDYAHARAALLDRYKQVANLASHAQDYNLSMLDANGELTPEAKMAAEDAAGKSAKASALDVGKMHATLNSKPTPAHQDDVAHVLNQLKNGEVKPSFLAHALTIGSDHWKALLHHVFHGDEGKGHAAFLAHAMNTRVGSDAFRVIGKDGFYNIQVDNSKLPKSASDSKPGPLHGVDDVMQAAKDFKHGSTYTNQPVPWHPSALPGFVHNYLQQGNLMPDLPAHELGRLAAHRYDEQETAAVAAHILGKATGKEWHVTHGMGPGGAAYEVSPSGTPFNPEAQANKWGGLPDPTDFNPKDANKFHGIIPTGDYLKEPKNLASLIQGHHQNGLHNTAGWMTDFYNAAHNDGLNPHVQPNGPAYETETHAMQMAQKQAAETGQTHVAWWNPKTDTWHAVPDDGEKKGAKFAPGVGSGENGATSKPVPTHENGAFGGPLSHEDAYEASKAIKAANSGKKSLAQKVQNLLSNPKALQFLATKPQGEYAIKSLAEKINAYSPYLHATPVKLPDAKYGYNSTVLHLSVNPSEGHQYEPTGNELAATHKAVQAALKQVKASGNESPILDLLNNDSHLKTLERMPLSGPAAKTVADAINKFAPEHSAHVVKKDGKHYVYPVHIEHTGGQKIDPGPIWSAKPGAPVQNSGVYSHQFNHEAVAPPPQYASAPTPKPAAVKKPLPDDIQQQVNAAREKGGLSSDAPMSVKLGAVDLLPKGVNAPDLSETLPDAQADRINALMHAGHEDAAKWLAEHYNQVNGEVKHPEYHPGQMFPAKTLNAPNPYQTPTTILNAVHHGGKELPDQVRPWMLYAQTPEQRQAALAHTYGDSKTWLKLHYDERDHAEEHAQKREEQQAENETGAVPSWHYGFNQPQHEGTELHDNPQADKVGFKNDQAEHEQHAAAHQAVYNTGAVPLKEAKMSANGHDWDMRALSPQEIELHNPGNENLSGFGFEGPAALVKHLRSAMADKAASLAPKVKELAHAEHPDVHDALGAGGVHAESRHAHALSVENYPAMLTLARAILPGRGIMDSIMRTGKSMHGDDDSARMNFLHTMRNATVALGKQWGLHSGDFEHINESIDNWKSDPGRKQAQRLRVVANMLSGRAPWDNVHEAAHGKSARDNARDLAGSLTKSQLLATLAHKAVAQAISERLADSDGHVPFLRGLGGAEWKSMTGGKSTTNGKKLHGSSRNLAGFSTTPQVANNFAHSGYAALRYVKPSQVWHNHLAPTIGSADSSFTSEKEAFVNAPNGGEDYVYRSTPRTDLKENQVFPKHELGGTTHFMNQRFGFLKMLGGNAA